MITEDAFELVVNNMRENSINNKKVFAKYMLGKPIDDFSKKLLDAWVVADGDCQERLAIGFPQLAYAILEYYTLPEKKREKYLNKLMGD